VTVMRSGINTVHKHSAPTPPTHSTAKRNHNVSTVLVNHVPKDIISIVTLHTAVQIAY